MTTPTLTELFDELEDQGRTRPWRGEDIVIDIRAALLRYEAAMDLAEVAGRLIDRIDEVYESKEYKAVWALAQLHNGPYSGPHFADEMDFARTALAAYRREVSNG